MRNKSERSNQSFRRSADWAKAHPDVLQAAPVLNAYVQTLTDVSARIEANAVEQGTQTKKGTVDVAGDKRLRTELRAQMGPIVQVVRGLKGTVPGIEVIKMPASGVSSEALITAAAEMAKNATIYQQVLLDHGLKADSLTSLQTATEALKASVDARGAARAARVRATKQITTDVSLGHKTVLLMDAVMRQQLRSDPATLASWRNAKRVTVKGVPTSASIAVTAPSALAPNATPQVVATPTVATHTA